MEEEATDGRGAASRQGEGVEAEDVGSCGFYTNNSPPEVAGARGGPSAEVEAAHRGLLRLVRAAGRPRKGSSGIRAPSEDSY